MERPGWFSETSTDGPGNLADSGRDGSATAGTVSLAIN